MKSSASQCARKQQRRKRRFLPLLETLGERILPSVVPPPLLADTFIMDAPSSSALQAISSNVVVNDALAGIFSNMSEPFNLSLAEASAVFNLGIQEASRLRSKPAPTG